jgi:hypothetical protein
VNTGHLKVNMLQVKQTIKHVIFVELWIQGSVYIKGLDTRKGKMPRVSHKNLQVCILHSNPFFTFTCIGIPVCDEAIV